MEVEIPGADPERAVVLVDKGPVVLVDRGPVGSRRRMMAAVHTGSERHSQKVRMGWPVEAADYQAGVEVVPATVGLVERTVRERVRTGSMVGLQRTATDHEEWSLVVEYGSPAEGVVVLVRLGYRYSLQMKTVGSAAGRSEGGHPPRAKSLERELVPLVEAVEG